MSESSRFARRVGVAAKLLVAVAALVTFGSRADAVAVKDFDVFVDPPTGFVFVKLPDAWKFVGRLDAEALSRLPTGVHTNLLGQDGADTQTACR